MIGNEKNKSHECVFNDSLECQRARRLEEMMPGEHPWVTSATIAPISTTDH